MQMLSGTFLAVSRSGSVIRKEEFSRSARGLLPVRDWRAMGRQTHRSLIRGFYRLHFMIRSICYHPDMRRKLGSFLSLATLLVAIGGSFCPAFAQHMTPKQAACCSSKPCHRSATTENCCTQMSSDGQFKAEFSNLVQAPHLTLLGLLTSNLPVLQRPFTQVEIAWVQHPPPAPIYTLNRSLLI